MFGWISTMLMRTHIQKLGHRSIYTFLLYLGNTKGWLHMQHTNVYVLQKKFQVQFRSILYTSPHNIIIIYSSTSWLMDYLHDVFLGTYSGRKLTRLGRSVAWSFFISLAFSLQDSRVSDLRFFRGFRCFNPPAVIRELETFRDTNSVNPVITLISGF